MLHLAKLAVGARDIRDLRTMQAERAERQPPLRHRTRNFPRRAAEVIDGGSMYWVVAGAMIVRQRILGIVEDTSEDGSACAGIMLDPKLVPVSARLMRPFQGWRYLNVEDAPADLRDSPAARGESGLPPALRRELRSLCLL
jgi:hypothetical protein